MKLPSPCDSCELGTDAFADLAQRLQLARELKRWDAVDGVIERLRALLTERTGREIAREITR